MAKKNVYVFLFDGFSDWEISYLMPEIAKSRKFGIKSFSIYGQSVVSSGNLKITPDLSFSELEIRDIILLVLPGGTAWEENKFEELSTLIKTLLKKNIPIAAICGATTFLGDQGVLDNLKHTSNEQRYLKTIAPHYRGEKNYKNVMACTDKNIITASGIAPIEFAREIFKTLILHSEYDIEKWFQLFKNGKWEQY